MMSDNDAEDLEAFNELVNEAVDKSDDDDVYPEDESVEVGSDASDASKEHANAKMWAVAGNNFSPCEKTVDILPAGQYTIENSPSQGIYFSKKEVNLDNLISLPDSASENVIASIEDFWSKETKFRDFGFLWKRGVLLWGPPGSGKTSTLQVLSKRITDIGGISIYISDPYLGATGLELLRRIEPTRPIIVMLEDIDALTQTWGEAAILALLDGELQIDNVVFIATTNYPEKLDKRLINRPSRFDIVKLIGMPSNEARTTYLSKKNPRLDTPEHYDELKEWVSLTKDFSIAHLKELIILVEVFDTPLAAAVKRLRVMMNGNISSSDNGNKIGFK